MNQGPNDLSERLFENASIGIIITDDRFNVRMVNASAARLLDVDPNEVKGKPVDELVPPYRRQVARKVLTRARELCRSVELRIVYPSTGVKRHLAIVVDPITTVENRVEGICLWVRDRTRRVAMERRLARIEKLASLGQMAGGLAHHLNNVLGGVVTAVDHALTCQDLVGARRALKLVSQGLANAVDLIRRLMEFSSPELPDQNLVDLTEGILSFVEQVQERLKAAERRIELEIKSVPIVAVHQFKMEQILSSLLANSEQALGERGGRIMITIESDETSAKIFFKDNGPGIPEEMSEKIFEPFFTTRGALGGGGEANLGLGLTLARRLTSEIGGTLSYCAPRDGAGSCFLIELPIRRTLSEP